MQATITVTAAMREKLGLSDTADSTEVNAMIKRVVCKSLGIMDTDETAKYMRELAYLRGEVEQGTRLTKIQAARMAWLVGKLGN